MAGNAVILDSFRRVATDPKVVAVGFKGHGNGMVVAISCLGQHLVDKRIPRQVAVDTSCPVPVGAVLPGGIMGDHGMAIDANLGVA